MRSRNEREHFAGFRPVHDHHRNIRARIHARGHFKVARGFLSKCSRGGPDGERLLGVGGKRT